MDNDSSGTLRELIELRIGAFEKMVSREFSYVKEAMERVADQSAPVATVQELLAHVGRLEKYVIEEMKNINDEAKQLKVSQQQANNKIRILWRVGSVIVASLIAILISFIKSWLGI